MVLTLFPVAAFLLLLSGIGAPAQPAGHGEASAALMRTLLDQWDAVHAGTHVAVAPREHAGRRATISAHPGSGETGFAHPSRSLEVNLRQRVQAVAGRCNQKQYRTRFGIAEGAYLAAGPPVSGFATA